jgi:uncharacterized protein with PIN domain
MIDWRGRPDGEPLLFKGDDFSRADIRPVTAVD